MSRSDKIQIELDPVDAMLILSFLRIVRDSINGLRGLTRAIDNYEYEVCNNITLEQVREADDGLAIYRLLAEAGL
jgi:hypothetical protein